MQKRTLTVRFNRAVAATTPSTVQVTVTPLATTSAVATNITFLGGPQTKTVLLANDTTIVTFSLVPSAVAGLTTPVPYRIAWRESFLGRQTSYDFVMPNHDVDLVDLFPGGS